MNRSHLFSAKPFCQISLFVIFLHFFGIPNIERYLRQEVMVVSSTKNSKGIPAPTISVFAANAITKRGWRSNNTTPSVELIDFHCGDASDIQKCITEETYNRSDVVKQVQIGYRTNESLMDPRFWQEEFKHPYYGRRFTLNIDRGLENDKDQIYIQLRPGLFYTVYIFDKNFFVKNINSLSFPFLSFPLTMKHGAASNEHYYWNIAVTERFELNHPDDPCDEGNFILEELING